MTLSTGEEISARLIVLANGLNIGLRHTLGMDARGDQLVPFDQHRLRCEAGRPAAASTFRALTYYPERVADRMAYLTLFPIGSAMRANLFVYRDMARSVAAADARMRRSEALFDAACRACAS